MTDLIALIYMLTMAALSFYGFVGLLTLLLYWRHRQETFPCPPAPPDLPLVTVQLPIYNERFVVERLIEAAAAIDYPADRLQIQVLDDSTDDTTARAAKLVGHYDRKGVNISLLHREHRQGYKAGALSHALAQARGEFIAVFDADFQPPPAFLQQTIPHFFHEPALGMVQARWDHLNASESPLTAAQAIALDKHFAIEQTVRHRASLFPKFNGAAGVWRRQCLEMAGGWQDDTVCEDLCLSTRAILQGWQFRFLSDVVAPAELPTTILAYKNQQARWAKGSIQCLGKFGRAILADRHQSRLARFYALISMSAYATHLFVLVLLLLQLPLIVFDYRFSSYMFFFTIAGVGQPLLFLLSQQLLYPDWRRRLCYFPVMLLVAIGTAPSNSRAILQAIFGRRHPFIRTPKRGCPNGRGQIEPADIARQYRLPFDWIVLVELLLATYAGAGTILALVYRNTGPLFFLLTSALGLGYVVYLGFRDM